MLATTLPAEGYPAAEVLAAYRLRWQIELAFKRLKSLLHIDRLRARTPAGARTWLYAHLLLALILDDLTQQMLGAFPEDLAIARWQPSIWQLQNHLLIALCNGLLQPTTIAGQPTPPVSNACSPNHHDNDSDRSPPPPNLTHNPSAYGAAPPRTSRSRRCRLFRHHHPHHPEAVAHHAEARREERRERHQHLAAVGQGV